MKVKVLKSNYGHIRFGNIGEIIEVKTPTAKAFIATGHLQEIVEKKKAKKKKKVDDTVTE